MFIPVIFVFNFIGKLIMLQLTRWESSLIEKGVIPSQYIDGELLSFDDLEDIDVEWDIVDEYYKQLQIYSELSASQFLREKRSREILISIHRKFNTIRKEVMFN